MKRIAIPIAGAPIMQSVANSHAH
ncbi:protein of unknown function [Pararobbsia alpina]